MTRVNWERFSVTPSDEVALASMRGVVYNLNLPQYVEVPGPVISGPPLRMPVSNFAAMRLELRRLVEAWFRSGPNLKKLFEEFPLLRTRAIFGRTHLIYGETGRGYLSWLPEIPDEDLRSQEDFALTHFMSLIANPKWELLGGPCARCGIYYLKKTKRQKAYCSRTCSSKRTAILAVKKKRQHDHSEKVRRAQIFIDKWSEGARRSDWKRWVASKTGYTTHWLTRALNLGHLRQPETTVCGERNPRDRKGRTVTAEVT